MGTGGGRKTSEEAITISREKMRRAQVPGGGKERRSSKGVRGNNKGTWDSVGSGKGSLEEDLQISKSDNWVEVTFFLWYRDSVSKEMEMSSLLDMSSLTCLGCGTAEWRHLKGHVVLELQTYI